MKPWALYVCLAAFLCGGNAWADEKDWLALMQRGNELQRNGQYREAETSFREAVRIGETFPPGDSRLPNALNSLSTICDELGRVTEAEHLLHRAIAMVAKAQGKQNAQYAVLVDNLGLHYLDHGQVAESEPFFREAIELYSTLQPLDEVRLAIARNGLALAGMNQRRYDEARELFTQALAAFRRNPAEGAGQIPVALNNLGVLARHQGKLEEARDFLDQAVKATETAWGKNHPQMVRPLNNLATVCLVSGDLAAAETAYQRALDIAKAALGASHPLYASVLLNYSQFLRRAGRSNESRALTEQANAILQDNAITDGAGMVVDVTTLQFKQ